MVAYAILFVLSILLFRERTVISDTACALFYMVKDQSWILQPSRWVAAFTQSFPVLGAKAGAPLQVVMQLYSVSFIVYYVICYVICGTFLKRYDLAIVILLVNILFVSHSFYWILSELPQGIAFLVVVLAFLSRFPGDIAMKSGVVISILGIVSAFFHPVVAVCVSYLFFFFIGTGRFGKQGAMVFVLAFAAAMLARIVFLPTRYDKHSMSGLRNFSKFFPNYFGLYSNLHFLKNCLSLYWAIPLCIILIVRTYIISRNLNKLLVFALYFTGYLLLVNVCYPTSATPDFYIENLYAPLALFIAIPLVFDVLPKLSKEKMVIYLSSLLILVSLVRIYVVGGKYTARLSYEEQLLSQYGNKKTIISLKKVNTNILEETWGAPFEFWLLSTLKNNSTASILIDEIPQDRAWAGAYQKAMVVNWNIFPYKNLPARYFHFADTTTGYVIVE